MVFEEIFQYADKNSDGYLSINEIITLASPDINNDKHISESERNIGIKTAKIWIAYILHFDRNNNDKILNDGKVSLLELKKFSKYETPVLWSGDYVNGEQSPNAYGEELFAEVEQLINV